MQIQTASGHHSQAVTALLDAKVTSIAGTVAVEVSNGGTPRTRSVSIPVFYPNPDGTWNYTYAYSTVSFPSYTVRRSYSSAVSYPEYVSADVVARSPMIQRIAESMKLTLTIGTDDPYPHSSTQQGGATVEHVFQNRQMRQARQPPQLTRDIPTQLVRP